MVTRTSEEQKKLEDTNIAPANPSNIEKELLERAVDRVVEHYELSDVSQVAGLSGKEILRVQGVGNRSLSLMRDKYPFDPNARAVSLKPLKAMDVFMLDLHSSLALFELDHEVERVALQAMEKHDLMTPEKIRGLTDEQLKLCCGYMPRTLHEEDRSDFLVVFSERAVSTAAFGRVREAFPFDRDINREIEHERMRTAALPVNLAMEEFKADHRVFRAYEALAQRLSESKGIRQGGHAQGLRRLNALLPKIHDVGAQIMEIFTRNGATIEPTPVHLALSDMNWISHDENVRHFENLGNALVSACMDSMLRARNPHDPARLLDFLRRAPRGFFYDPSEIEVVYSAIHACILNLKRDINAAGAEGLTKTDLAQRAEVIFDTLHLKDVSRRAALRWASARVDEGWMISSSGRFIRKSNSARG